MYRKYIFIIISPQKNYSSRDIIPLTRYSEDTVGSHSLQHPHPVQGTATQGLSQPFYPLLSCTGRSATWTALHLSGGAGRKSGNSHVPLPSDEAGREGGQECVDGSCDMADCGPGEWRARGLQRDVVYLC